MNWQTLEDDDITVEGFVVISKDGNNSYAAPTANSLFATKEAADVVVTEMVRKGMPIGFARVAQAKLLHKRKLEIILEEEQPKLVVLTNDKG